MRSLASTTTNQNTFDLLSDLADDYEKTADCNEMDPTNIYVRAIKRTFAELYSVSPEAVDVSWKKGDAIVVKCAGKTFVHPILSDDDAPEFICPGEDSVVVTLTDEERRELQLLLKL
jgi:hypothetical protein